MRTREQQCKHRESQGMCPCGECRTCVENLGSDIERLEARVKVLEGEVKRLRDQWLYGGMTPALITAGTRVRYHPIFGDRGFLTGSARRAPWLNTGGAYVVHVDLDDGGTIHSAWCRHLAPDQSGEGG